MRLIKLAIISVIVLFLLITVISLLIPSHISISRAANFPANDTIVYQSTRDLSKWKNWHPALKSISENEIRSGADQLEVRGTTIILKDATNDEITVSMAEDKGRPVWTGFKFIKHPGIDSTTVQWHMDFKLRWYPWEKFRSLFYENIYGVQMEQGLSNLKKLSEDRSSSK